MAIFWIIKGHRTQVKMSLTCELFNSSFEFKHLLKRRIILSSPVASTSQLRIKKGTYNLKAKYEKRALVISRSLETKLLCERLCIYTNLAYRLTLLSLGFI